MIDETSGLCGSIFTQRYKASMIVHQHSTTKVQLSPIPPKTLREVGLTLAAYLMGCIKQSNTGYSVIEMHINLLFH